jgi:hypothetical protein
MRANIMQISEEQEILIKYYVKWSFNMVENGEHLIQYLV